MAFINRKTLRMAWCPLQIMAATLFFLKYFYQFHYFQEHEATLITANARIIGFERFGPSTGNEPVDASTWTIWNGLGQELTILILSTVQCVLQWWIVMEPKHANIEDQKAVINWRHRRIYYDDDLSSGKGVVDGHGVDGDDEAMNQLIDDRVSDDHEDSLVQPLKGVDSEDDESSVSRFKSQRSQRAMSQAALFSALQYAEMTWKVLWRCGWRTLRRVVHVLTNIFWFYGVELSVIVMVFASFYRV